MGAKINLMTGKIIGAEPDSFAWYHEEGHKIYSDSDMGIKNSYNQQMSLYSSVLFCVLSLFIKLSRYFALLSILLFIYYFVKEEFWCDKYAREKIEKNNLQEMKGGKDV